MERLRTRAQFQALLSTTAVARTAHFALHRRAEPWAIEAEGAALFRGADSVWMGAMAPKRWARRAVTRNAIRRQIYSMAGQLSPPLAAGAYLVRLRSGFAKSQFPSAWSDALKDAVRLELTQLFTRVHP